MFPGHKFHLSLKRLTWNVRQRYVVRRDFLAMHCQADPSTKICFPHLWNGSEGLNISVQSLQFLPIRQTSMGGIEKAQNIAPTSCMLNVLRVVSSVRPFLITTPTLKMGSLSTGSLHSPKQSGCKVCALELCYSAGDTAGSVPADGSLTEYLLSTSCRTGKYITVLAESKKNNLQGSSLSNFVTCCTCGS